MSIQVARWKAVVGVCKYQIYISRSSDPFLNLSIEHYLFQKSPPHSTILFLYANKPCVVIGRNQNPWLETNLKALQRLPSPDVTPSQQNGAPAKSALEEVLLVRRRSGGGAVFHDMGNVNYSIICPTADFTRDKHAEMVTEALRKGNMRARVNERHDIVLDQGNPVSEKEWPDAADMHKTRFRPGGDNGAPLKISGSAYKLTRLRSLHHGTCLLASEDLDRISRCLSSPARPFIKARGVESVRSPIGNVNENINRPTFTTETFRNEVIKSFMKLHRISNHADPVKESLFTETLTPEGDEFAAGWVGFIWSTEAIIREGMDELKSYKWLYGQTPQFILSSHSTEEDERVRPPLPEDFPASARVYLKIKSGTIISSRISISSDNEAAAAEAETVDAILIDKNIHEISDFKPLLEQGNIGTSSDVSSISKWLNTMLGR